MKFKGVKINYVFLKTAEARQNECILFLHGWGGGVVSFWGLSKFFSESNCLLLDFPPFGESDDLITPWTLDDYADAVFCLLNYLKIKKIKIISHSFGGRVAILLASNYNIDIEKLVLIDSAGMKPKFNICTKAKIVKYKILKSLGVKQENKGSKDYKALSPVMKQTFQNILRLHLEKYCPNIRVPTLIIFGEKDRDTPLYMAKRLNKLIKSSRLVVLKDCGHWSYVEKLDESQRIINCFFGVATSSYIDSCRNDKSPQINNP